MGNSFELIVAADGLSGEFDDVNLPVLDPGMFWDADYQGNTFTLGVVDHVLGDMDGDGDVDEADVPLFVLALTNRADYDAEGFLTNTDAAGDVNLDGSFDFGDINAFSVLFAEATNGQAVAVPEPSTLVLTLGAVAFLWNCRRRTRPANSWRLTNTGVGARVCRRQDG